MKIVLMGTPDFVVPIFDAIAARHDVIAVFTRAPKPVGRKHIITILASGPAETFKR